MNKFESTAIDLAISLFSRKRRRRDREIIRGLAEEMVSDGKSALGQAANLAGAGIVDRASGGKASLSSKYVRDSLAPLGAFLAPIAFATVLAVGVMTVAFEVFLPDNRLGTDMELDVYSLVHGVIPWLMAIIGAAFAAVGFATRHRNFARYGSGALMISATLVVGSMGGWWSESFAGPALLPLSNADDLGDFAGMGERAYVIGSVWAMSILLVLASLAVPKDRADAVFSSHSLRVLLPGIGLALLLLVSCRLSDTVAVAISTALVGFLVFMPVAGIWLRGRDGIWAFSAMRAGLVMLAFTVPSVLLLGQLLTALDPMSSSIGWTAYVIGIPVLLIGGFAIAVRSVFVNRTPA